VKATRPTPGLWRKKPSVAFDKLLLGSRWASAIEDTLTSLAGRMAQAGPGIDATKREQLRISLAARRWPTSRALCLPPAILMLLRRKATGKPGASPSEGVA
jgi:hypothetical protein